MDCKVDDGQIIPLRYRLCCEIGSLPVARCQGRVHTRSEALRALSRGRPPATIDDIERRLEAVEARRADTTRGT